mmetsp:Transcript_7942/g.24754  ORF Transcript_7942/g.24754 Transcript_7942/m.24754 type:complete len:141 (+) Transcript_7942:288-710(+)
MLAGEVVLGPPGRHLVATQIATIVAGYVGTVGPMPASTPPRARAGALRARDTRLRMRHCHAAPDGAMTILKRRAAARAPYAPSCHFGKLRKPTQAAAARRGGEGAQLALVRWLPSVSAARCATREASRARWAIARASAPS